MIQVNDRNIQKLSLYNHVQHYGNSRGVVVRVQPGSAEDLYDVYVSKSDSDIYDVNYQDIDCQHAMDVLFWAL